MRRIKPLVLLSALVRTLLAAPSLLLILAVSASYSLAQQLAHPLPQALPGTNYAAQLSIPPGLGYPFARCELQGQPPRWLTIDCARLQIKGRVPVGVIADYKLTLRIEDHAGNALDFPLALKVSNAPQFVNLAQPDSPAEPAPDTSRSVDLPPSVEPHRNPENDSQLRPPPRPEIAANVSPRHDVQADAYSEHQPSDATLTRTSTASTFGAKQKGADNGESLEPQRQPLSLSPTPAIIGLVDAGATAVNVFANKGDALSLYSIPPDPKNPDPDPTPLCTATDVEWGSLLPLKATATDSAVVTRIVASFKDEKSADGIQVLNLQQPLLVGTKICVAEQAFSPPRPDKKHETGTRSGATLPDHTEPRFSRIATVQDTLDWGRVRAYFVGGVLISNTQNSFSSSSANQFLDLNIDKFWHLPDCTANVDVRGNCATPFFSHGPGSTGFRKPGFSTYFDTRLTAIPVGVSNTAAGAGTGDNTLTTQKTARVQVGAYLPFILTNWSYNKSGNALYVAPIAKIGFDTLTGTTTPTATVSGSPVTASLNRVYNFYSFGGRVGHFGLYPTRSKSPELQSYLDISFGPYSNLESYICEAHRNWGSVYPLTPGVAQVSACGVGPLAGLDYASLKRVWRLDLEGLLKIPATPLVIGFNANIGQKALGAQNIDTMRIPADDVRFLFGTKFDVATVMKKLGVGQ